MAQKNLGRTDKATEMTAQMRVEMARDSGRPHIRAFIDALFSDFFEQRGDRQFRDDPSILCGIAKFDGISVTVAGHVKGEDLTSNVRYNFGMPHPEGYRKFIRAVKQAEKFKRPIVTFIDTPGAYPGKGAEERGQGEAIAQCLYLLSEVKVPVITIVTGEGGSGGALALSVADRIIMLENAVYSILSPEGFASILWKDASRSDEACEVMKLTAKDLCNFGIADSIVKEPKGGIGKNPKPVYTALKELLREQLKTLSGVDTEKLIAERYEKFRKIGR